MKPGSLFPTVVLLSTAAVLAVWLAVEHQRRLRLGDEHGALEQRVSQMAALRESNVRMSDLVARATSARSAPDDEFGELLRLRGEVGVLRQQTAELETVRSENRQAHAALEGTRTRSARAPDSGATADYWPRDSWEFRGYATADAALQTTLWAADNGDLKTLAAATTGDVQKILESEVGGKSEGEAAARAMDHVVGVKSIRLLSREVQSDDTVLFTAEIENRTDTQTGKLLMKRVGNEWKLSGLPP